MQCKKQPIVQLEPLYLVSTVQLNTNILIQFFLVILGNQLALVLTNKVDIIRDGLSPVFIRFWHQTWFGMSLKSWNSMRKYMVSSGRKYFLNTCITVIRFTPGIRVSATAYLAWVTLLLIYICIQNMVWFGKEFPWNMVARGCARRDLC